METIPAGLESVIGSTANLTLRILFTLSLMISIGTRPALTESSNGCPKNAILPEPISTSSPFIAALTVLCVPAQSDTTSPLKPHSFFSI